MGTTQRMTPGVSGEPNWADLNKTITHVSKNVEKEKELEENDKISPNDEARVFARIANRRRGLIKSVYKNLVKTGGGRKKITSGKSRSIGKAGLKSAGRITGFLTGVGNNGLQNTLVEIGFGSLLGKTFKDVLDFLLIFCSKSNVGMDETAANSASCEIMKELADEAGNNLEKFELVIKDYVDGRGLSDILCKFWGLYVFEHLSQRFEEKIKQQKGIEVGKETFLIIKEDILGQIRVINNQRPIVKINWSSSAGKEEIEKIFDSVIKILCDENN